MDYCHLLNGLLSSLVYKHWFTRGHDSPVLLQSAVYSTNKKGAKTVPWGAQGTVFAPFLFVLYTADCRSTGESCPLVKFADDTELVGKISNDEDAQYHKQNENSVNWCDKHYLYLNVSETKRCALILGRIKDTPNQSTLKEKQWRE